jgi:hypothetical protein
MLLGLPDPDPPLLCTDTDLLSTSKKSIKKTLIYNILRLLFYFYFMKTDVNIPLKKLSKQTLKKLILFLHFVSH